MFSGCGPSAITRATFHEYLICSSVVPAVPWIVSVEQPLIAAARCSDSQLLPVPGSPTSSSARSLASVTIARSTSESSPKNLRVIATSIGLPSIVALSGFAVPTMYASTERGDSFHALGGVSASFCCERRELGRVLHLGGLAQDVGVARVVSLAMARSSGS